MNRKRVRTVFLTIIGVLVLLYFNYGFTHPPKARAQHIMSVNSVHDIKVTFELTNSSPAKAP